ncbi:MAG: plastocyanin/azurin family copper-binding protein [Candidatus Kariarchaeaceae archaeon]
MRKVLTITTFLLFLGLFISSMAVTQVAAQEDHHDDDSHCDTPTEFVEITADAADLKFDKDELKVSRNTCVQLTFTNLNPLVEHDFTVDHVEGTDGIEKIHVHLANNQDGHMGDGVAKFNFTTPDADKTFRFYCSIPGHESSMKGDLIVGEGSEEEDAPGFGVFIALSTILAVAIITPRIRKR